MMSNSEVNFLEDVKTKVQETKDEVLEIINEKFDDLFEIIDNRIAQLEGDEDIFEDTDEDEEDVEIEEEEDTSVQDRVRQSLLTQQVANQIKAQSEVQEPVAVVVPSTPAPSLSEMIKQQVNQEQTENAPAVNLTELIANQVNKQQDLSVVAPESIEDTIEVVEAPADEAQPVRNMSAIIAELRRDVNVEVEASTEQATEQLVQQAAAVQQPEAETAQDLSKTIRQQILTNEVKKQLS